MKLVHLLTYIYDARSPLYQIQKVTLDTCLEINLKTILFQQRKRTHHWNTYRVYTVTVSQIPIALVFVHNLDEAW